MRVTSAMDVCGDSSVCVRLYSLKEHYAMGELSFRLTTVESLLEQAEDQCSTDLLPALHII